MLKKDELINLVKKHRHGQTWWMSDFYADFCKLYGLDDNNSDKMESNANKIRKELNKLVHSGDLIKVRYGSGHGGKSLFGSTWCFLWKIVDKK